MYGCANNESAEEKKTSKHKTFKIQSDQLILAAASVFLICSCSVVLKILAQNLQRRALATGQAYWPDSTADSRPAKVWPDSQHCQPRAFILCSNVLLGTITTTDMHECTLFPPAVLCTYYKHPFKTHVQYIQYVQYVYNRRTYRANMIQYLTHELHINCLTFTLDPMLVVKAESHCRDYKNDIDHDAKEKAFLQVE